MATAERTAALPAPPHNLEAEQSVLGAVLLSDRALYGLVIGDGLRPEDFYRERHRLDPDFGNAGRDRLRLRP